MASSGHVVRRLPPRLPAAAEHPRCPRCNSQETKFCYYNNYNPAQPRHFCKSCRRYWTLGGSLRNVPVGGTSRRSGASSSFSYVPRRRRSDQRHSSSSSTSSSAVADHAAQPVSAAAPTATTYDPELTRTFGALLAEPLPVGFLTLGDGYHAQAGGFRIGFGGIEEIGFGTGKTTTWPFIGDVVEESAGGSGRPVGGGLGDRWPLHGGYAGDDTAGLGDVGGCFGWPDRTISSTATQGQGKGMQ